nr:hypothetical protein DBT53_10445 [Aerococcus mictus]
MDDLVEKLRHAAMTASNDDVSEPRSEKRMRHTDRVDAMLTAADRIESDAAEIAWLRAEVGVLRGALVKARPVTSAMAAADNAREFQEAADAVETALSSPERVTAAVDAVRPMIGDRVRVKETLHRGREGKLISIKGEPPHQTVTVRLDGIVGEIGILMDEIEPVTPKEVY